MEVCTFRPAVRAVPDFVKKMGSHSVASRIMRSERLHSLSQQPAWHLS
jgi:hypothetical protein